jgi:benzoyl-CoA reductase/2-hydroxyglutaryl-CoA dehydratase subunit BcrC/BadD/HgdB
MDLIHELETIAENPGASVLKAMKQTGKKAVGCFPIYAPEEIVYAAGMLPVGMWGGHATGNLANKYLQGFCCSIMKANTEQALKGDYECLSAVIMTSYCDTLKCLMENWKVASPQLHIIPIVYAQNRKIEAGKTYMLEEFERVKDELEKITGEEISEVDLITAVDLYDDYRATMQEFVEIVNEHPSIFKARTRHLIIKAAYYMDKKDYTAKIKTLIEEVNKMQVKPDLKLKKIILTGLMSEPNGFLDLLTENNMLVVSDDLAQESRQFRTIAPKEGTALRRMAERIALQDGCTFLYDAGKTRGQRLIEMKKKYDADAIIFCQLKFCDPDEFDYPILKKEMEKANIPMLHVELEQQMDSLEQLRTRVQSFAEMLA